MMRRKNWLEWTVFVLGLALMSGVLGFLSYDALTRSTGPPDLHLALGQSRAGAGRFVVPVLITNRGETTAEDVHVEILLRGAGGREERAALEFPFVPRHARRNGWVTFETDPARGRLQGIILGYRED